MKGISEEAHLLQRQMAALQEEAFERSRVRAPSAAGHGSGSGTVDQSLPDAIRRAGCPDAHVTSPSDRLLRSGTRCPVHGQKTAVS